MKRIFTAFGIVLFCLLNTAQSFAFQESEYYKALANGAKAKITVQVFDERDTCISNASVRAYFRISSGKGEGKCIVGKTDEHGIFTAEGRTTDRIFLTVEKPNYYVSRKEYVASSRGKDRLSKGRWLPWNPMIRITLRKIKNPVPMYISFAGTRNTPSTYDYFPIDTEIGFDCQEGSFVEPYGNGKTIDFNVRVSSFTLPKEVEQTILETIPKMENAKTTMERETHKMVLGKINKTYYEFVLSTPNGDGGFIRKQLRDVSEYRSDYESPEKGFSPVFRTFVEETPFPKFNSPTDISEKEYLIFQSRVVRDEMGNIVSANYGKIIGPIKHGIVRYEGKGYMHFRCYYNPEANNRSIEFDGKNNLFYPQYKTSIHDP